MKRKMICNSVTIAILLFIFLGYNCDYTTLHHITKSPRSKKRFIHLHSLGVASVGLFSLGGAVVKVLGFNSSRNSHVFWEHLFKIGRYSLKQVLIKFLCGSSSKRLILK